MLRPPAPGDEAALRARLVSVVWVAVGVPVLPMTAYAWSRGDMAPTVTLAVGAILHLVAGLLLWVGRWLAAGRTICVGMWVSIAVIATTQGDPFPVVVAVVPTLIATAALPLSDIVVAGLVALGLTTTVAVRHLGMGVPAMVDPHAVALAVMLGSMLNLAAVGLGVATRRGTDRLLHQTRRDREQLEQVFRQAGVGLVLLDDDGIVQRRNPAAHQALRDRSLAEAEAAPPEHLKITSVPLHQGGRLVVLEDQHEATQRSRLLREARDAALEASEAKSVFLANMSHELRTPLNAIIGYAEMLLEEGDLQPAAHDDAGRIERSGRQLLQLIDDILDLARVEAGRLVLSPTRFDVERLVDDVVTDLRPRLTEGVELRTRSDGERHFVGDRKATRQVITNLVSNAVKYTESGHIEVRSDRHDNGLTLRVSDTGAGMDAATVERLFERFYRDKDATAPGTGLGMAIVQQLVQRMGGTVTARSEVGRGTTVTVHLPPMALRASPMAARRVER